MEQDTVLSLENITKVYPGVVALDNVSIAFRRGEVHALLGENGAGKSTLIKTISGAIAPDDGIIRVEDASHRHMTPSSSKQAGIEVVYQEFNLVEALTIAENIYLGETERSLFSERAIEKRAQALFDELHLELDPSQGVETLSPAKKQLTEICKSISRNAKVLIMDEPSAPLSAYEVDILYSIVDTLKAKGTTIIYISHRMEEIFRLADRVTVLRDGKYVDTVNTTETDRHQLVSMMVGRELKESYPKRLNPPGETRLEIKNLTGNGDEDISFAVRAGEIYGLAGLVGAGRTELASVIFGAVPAESGVICINGRETRIRSPRQAIKAGMGLIPEDRKFLGCLQEATIRFNITLASIRELSHFGLVQGGEEKKLAEEYKERLNIKTPSLEQEVRNLSGGNQQKVVLAKSLAAGPDILIFDEPTRGIDVGAKQEIYNLMNELADKGKAILMISSDMEELLGMSDRLGVLHEGAFAGELERVDFDPKLVIALASGMTREEFACQK